MIKDAKVSIKLEVCRDKTSGKLSITAHFNSNSPNVIQDKDGYCWMPTVDEKDLLNEAFELVPMEGRQVSPMKPTSKSWDKKEEMLMPEPMVGEELKPEPEPLQPVEEVKKPANLPPLEPPNESDVSEVTDNHIKNDDFEKIIDKKIDEASSKKDEQKDDKKVDELIIEEPQLDEPAPEDPMIDEPPPDEPEGEKKEYGEDMIVKADQEAIEAALKKHTKEAESIVEADEQTIIDKVLSQKKKGKWSKR